VLELIDPGGCGSFYAISISSPEFKGLSMIKQQRLVNDCLKEDIKGIHGLQVCIFLTPLGSTNDERDMERLTASSSRPSWRTPSSLICIENVSIQDHRCF
jgi:acid stress-induced BolA-like protein IbaG/YrbA